LRIGYFADGLWAHKALCQMLKHPEYEVDFIVVRYDTQDPVLIEMAENNGIKWLAHENVNSPEFLSFIQERQPDLLVSMSFNQILKREILEIAPRGFINCHAGALPFYRGRNVLNWALINGEVSYGVTVHYIDEGIDTGDIIVQKHGAIDPADNYATILDKASDLCADALLEALLLIYENRVTPKKQAEIHPVGFYCGRRLPGDESINWEWSSERIHNFVRAITSPAPGARTMKDGQELIVWKTSLIPGAPSYIGTPGEVVGKDRDGVIVKTGDSTIRMIEVSYASMPDARFVPRFKIGTRLGMDIMRYIHSLEDRVKALEAELLRRAKDEELDERTGIPGNLNP